MRLEVLLITLLLGGCSFLNRPTERLVTVSGKPTFEKNESYASLLLKKCRQDISVLWPDSAPKPASLNPHTTYQFDLLFGKSKMSIGGRDVQTIESFELVKVREHERLLHDESICKVHKAQMERKLVPICYGLIIFEDDFSKAWLASFPNDGTRLGGCMPDPFQKEEYAWVCAQCVEASKKWETSKGEPSR